MRPVFATLVNHGPKRLSRRQKKHEKTTYLLLIARIAERLYEKKHGKKSPWKKNWKQARKLRVVVSFVTGPKSSAAIDAEDNKEG